MASNGIAADLEEALWTLPMSKKISSTTNTSYTFVESDRGHAIATVGDLGVVVLDPGVSHEHEYFKIPGGRGKCVSIGVSLGAFGTPVGLVVRGNVAQVVEISKGTILDEITSGDGLPWQSGKWHPSEKSVFGLNTKVE